MTWEQLLPATTNCDTTAVLTTARLLMDRDAFAGFYERSARPLWAYLARTSGDPALADDLMQESFVKFLCAAAQTDGEVEARRYLFRIATNLLKDHWRKRTTSSIEELPEAVFSSGAMATRMDSLSLLEPALAKMKPKERQMLWLAYAEGYSHKEIAEVTGVGTTSVRLLLYRARKKMAGILTNGECV